MYLQFYAPLDERTDKLAAKEVNYDHKQLPEDLQLLQEKQYTELAVKQCLKMCYYLQKVRNIEILQMKAEFLRDENDNIWFTFAKDIQIRRINSKISLTGYDSKKIGETLTANQIAQKDLLLRELQEYENSLGEQNENEARSKSKMLTFMDEYYKSMKLEMGIDPNYAVEEDDPQLDIVLQKLRPNTTAQNFREFLTKFQNFKKTRAWKQVARKVHA